MISAVFSAVLTFIIVLLRTSLLHLLFGKIEPDVMSACETYLLITTLSLPFLAVYDAGAALCRSIGKTNLTMYISLAANGVAQSIWSLASIMGLAMAPVYTTVIGQCMGARDIDSANFYFKKLNKITLVLSVLWNALVFMITPLIVRNSAISPEAKELVIILVLINNIFNGLAYPFAGSLGKGLRAAGDVKFTMVVSIFLTVAARLFFSALFWLWLDMGVIGVAIGMSIDLVFRGAIFI